MSSEEATIKNMLDDATAEMAALHGHINYLRKKLKMDPLVSLANEQGGRPQGLRSDSFFGHTIGGAAQKYLSIVKEPKPLQDIAEALKAGGLVHNSKSLANTINSVLFRYQKAEKVFVQLPTGEWALREWYPALKKSKKNGDSADDGESLDEAELEAEAEESPKGEKQKG